MRLLEGLNDDALSLPPFLTNAVKKKKDSSIEYLTNPKTQSQSTQEGSSLLEVPTKPKRQQQPRQHLPLRLLFSHPSLPPPPSQKTSKRTRKITHLVKKSTTHPQSLVTVNPTDFPPGTSEGVEVNFS